MPFSIKLQASIDERVPLKEFGEIIIFIKLKISILRIEQQYFKYIIRRDYNYNIFFFIFDNFLMIEIRQWVKI